MPFQLFHNELSMPVGDCGRDAAVGHLRAFVALVRAALGVFEHAVLNLDAPVADLAFGSGEPLAILRNDARCVEESRFLKTVRDRSPFRQAAVELEGVPPDGYDYRLSIGTPPAERQALALGLAHRHDGLALSLPTAPCGTRTTSSSGSRRWGRWTTRSRCSPAS